MSTKRKTLTGNKKSEIVLKENESLVCVKCGTVLLNYRDKVSYIRNSAHEKCLM